jgi:hypothetical protein
MSRRFLLMDRKSSSKNLDRMPNDHPSVEELFFEKALREMSMEAFYAVIECGVRDVEQFIGIREDLLLRVPGISREVANEVLAARDHMVSARNPANAKAEEWRVPSSASKNEPATARFNTARATRITTSAIRGLSQSKHLESSEPPRWLSRRAYNVLRRNYITTVGQFLSLGEDDLRSFWGAGSKTVGELVQLQELLICHSARADDGSDLMQMISKIQGPKESIDYTRLSDKASPVRAILEAVGQVAEGDRIPEDVLGQLSTRSRNILKKYQMTRVGRFLALSEADMYSFRNAGVKTVNELMQLQEWVRPYVVEARCQDKPSHQCCEDGEHTGAPDGKCEIWQPAEWSVLRKPLCTLGSGNIQMSGQADCCVQTGLVRDLGLCSEDLEALRSIAVFPHDSLEDLHALSLGILARCDISASGFLAIISGLSNASLDTDELFYLDQMSETPVIQPEDVAGLPTAWLQAFEVPANIVDSLNGIGIYTFQESVGISEKGIVSRLGLLPESLKIIYRLWLLREHLHSMDLERREEIQIVCTSYERVWDELMKSIARSSRNRKIIEGRLGILDDRKWTLEELGAEFGITRERVRQIERRSMRMIRNYGNQTVLKPVWDAMEQLLWRSGGVCIPSETASFLCEWFGWPSAPSPQGIIALNEIGGRFEVIEENGETIIRLREAHPCLQCGAAKHSIVQLVSQQEDGITVDKASESLAAPCAHSCPSRLGGTVQLSRGCILQLASNTNEVRIQGSTLYSEQAWALRFGSVLETVDVALMAAGRAIHYTDLQRDIQEMGRDISERNVHACLSSRSEVALLWDRGTYIHREYVEIPFDLIHKIEADAIGRLKNGLPLLSVNGLFQEYQTQLQQHGVPTDRALYSCLKMAGKPELAYTRFPYITLEDEGSKRPTVFSILEDFVCEHEEGVATAEIEQYLVSDLGVSDQLKYTYIYGMPNIIQIDTGLHMHIDHLSVDSAGLRPVRDYVDEFLTTAETVSVDKIFDDKEVTCRLLGISTPVMLYSLLQTFYGDRYELPRYPIVARTDSTGETSVIAQIVGYLREAEAPCSVGQLYSHFVDGLGFKESSVYGARYHADIVQCAQGVIVHKDALEWTPAKQECVERIASIHLHEQRVLGKPYGLIERLFESNKLPPIPFCAPWTPLLLGELLCCGGEFRIIGTQRNAFVEIPNDDGIEDLQSFVHVLLEREFGGAANLEELEKYLQDAGILRRALRPSMLGDGSRVIIDGNIVLLADLEY